MTKLRQPKRGDKHDRWEFQHWSEERDLDEEELPDREEPEPIHTTH